ncbi:MAG: hypothetical protein V3T53_04250 [Phycisphaerales bacterium]
MTLAGALAVVGAVGCHQIISPAPSARRVSLAEFAGPPVSESSSPQTSDPGEADQVSAQTLGNVPARSLADQDAADLENGPGTSGESPTDLDTFSQLEQRTVFALTQPGDRVIVDSLVGEVNGRPIFADEFLALVEDRLIQVAKQTTGVQRVEAFDAIVRRNLREWVKNDLILADAESALNEQEQRGLFAFMQSLKERVIREEGRGARYEAEQKLRGEVGAGDIEEFLGRQRDFILFDQLRRQKIAPRIVVSQRDIEHEYQRRYQEFNPPPRVTLAKLNLLTQSQADLIDQVSQRLTSGEAFPAIAEDMGVPNGGVWDTFDMGPGGITDIEVTDAVKAQLEGLGQGQTTEPFVQGTSTIWLHIQKVERRPGRSLFDVQRQLADEIQKRRNNEEWERYIGSLFEKGIYDELEDMADRLLEIALQRYAR